MYACWQVWGKHWQYHTEKKFKYTHKKYWKYVETQPNHLLPTTPPSSCLWAYVRCCVCRAIGAVIFDGKLSKDEVWPDSRKPFHSFTHGSNTLAPLLWPQVGAQLEGSFARRRARLEKERREAVKREWEDSYTDFVKWCVLRVAIA